MNWWLSSLYTIIFFVGLTVVAWTVTKVPLVVIRIVIVIRKVILGGIVSQATLIVVLNVPSLILNLTLTVLYFLATTIVIQLNVIR